MSIKKRSGSSWVDVPVKKRSGASWIDTDVYRYDGSKWVKITAQEYTKTWEATWSQTYRSTNAQRPDTRGKKNMLQGDSGQDPWNIQRSLCGFGNIQSELSGAKIESVQIYLKANHFWYNAGGYVTLGYHNHSSKPTTFSHSSSGIKSQKFTSRTQAQWITMPKAFAEGIRDGKYKGFSIYNNTTNKNYYGEWLGATSSYKPKIRIKYVK